MLDPTTIRGQLEAAITTFSDTLVELFSDEVERLRAAHEAQRETHVEEPPVRHLPEAKPPARKKAPRIVKPLLNRPNVHVVPSRPASDQTSLAPMPFAAPAEPPSKGPAPNEIARRAERVVLASSLPPTFEKIRRALRVSKLALEPVLDQLLAERKIVADDVGGVILYKPPRIEPIRRRRDTTGHVTAT